MIDLRDVLERLLQRRDLPESEAGELLVALTDAATAPAMAGALLAALRVKGVTAPEVRGFAGAMRSLARHPRLPPGPPAIDIVGTGGDGSGSFNLSTGAALLVAAMGVRVVKHGNRSISSRSGSADLLEALGLPLPLDEQGAGDCLAATGFTFLFAPHYHPAMKEVAPVRRALGVRTVFNLLGPLTNPAEPPFGLIGVQPGQVTRELRDPLELGLRRCTPADLAGGDADHNAAGLRAVLEGRDTGAHCDAIVLNAALALEVTGAVPTAAAGVAAAIEAIRRGDGVRLLERLAAFGQGQRMADSERRR